MQTMWVHLGSITCLTLKYTQCSVDQSAGELVTTTQAAAAIYTLYSNALAQIGEQYPVINSISAS